MKYQDINNRYTEIISQYMAQGYTINTSTMSGSQGEIAKIDLTDGKEVIRILIQSFHNWRENVEGVEIVIGRSTDNIAPHGADTMLTIWTTHLEVISTERYYKLGENRKREIFYGTEAEGKAVAELQFKRWRARRDNATQEFVPSPEAIKIAKKVIRKQFGTKRIIESDIKISKSGNKYTVSYRGKAYSLH